MQTRNKQPRQPDVNQTASGIVQPLREGDTIQPPTKEQISAFMAQLGRKGGKIGGKRRLKTLSSRQRKQIARKAARARWGKEARS